MSIYELVTMTDSNGTYEVVRKTDADGKIWSVPVDETNSEYQSYLAYVANGNQTPTIQ